jgi:hypothetical protein
VPLRSLQPPYFAAHKKYCLHSFTWKYSPPAAGILLAAAGWEQKLLFGCFLVFSPGGCPAPQVPHGLVVAEHGFYLCGQRMVQLWQALLHILVYGGFADPEVLRCTAHRGPGIGNVLPDQDAALVDRFVHRDPSLRFGKHMLKNEPLAEGRKILIIF